MMTKSLRHAAYTIVTTLMVTTIPSPVLSETPKLNHPTIATVKKMTAGDRACYVEMVDPQGKLSTQFASFDICEQDKKFIGQRVQLTYTAGKILAASCQGDVDCGKTDSVMLITKMRFAGATAGTLPPSFRPIAAATIQPQAFTFTRGKKEQGFPAYKQATVMIPTVTAGPNPAVLKQVQAAIDPKAVLGESVKELETEFKTTGWLSTINYTVDYNKNSIVQLTYTKEGVSAYPSTFKFYVAVDLQTGKVIKVADLLTPEGLKKVADTINQSMQKRIQTAIAQNANQDTDLKSRLSGKQFQVENLNTFVIGEKGITFIYDFDFPHVIQALAPDGKFFLSYPELQPSVKPIGRLGR
jgi:hypothetical protein